jgi:hypothetical protein
MERSFCGRRDQNTKGEEMVRSLTLDIANEFNALLVSLDGEMAKRAKLVVNSVDIEDTVIL